MIEINFNEIVANAENEALEIVKNINIDFAVIREGLGNEKSNKILFKRLFIDLRFSKTHLRNRIISGLNAAVGDIYTYVNEDFKNKKSTKIIDFVHYKGCIILIHETYSADTFYTIVLNGMYEKNQKHLLILEEAFKLIDIMRNLYEVKNSDDYWTAARFIK